MQSKQMSTINFSRQIADRLGIDEATATLATTKTLAIIKAVGDKELMSKISAAISGTAEKADAGSMASSPDDPDGGGQLDQISEMEPDDIGDSRGRGAGLGSALATAGLSADKMGGFVTGLVQFVRDNAGSDVADQLLKKVPMLKSMIEV